MDKIYLPLLFLGFSTSLFANENIVRYVEKEKIEFDWNANGTPDIIKVFDYPADAIYSDPGYFKQLEVIIDGKRALFLDNVAGEQEIEMLGENLFKSKSIALIKPQKYTDAKPLLFIKEFDYGSNPGQFHIFQLTKDNRVESIFSKSFMPSSLVNNKKEFQLIGIDGFGQCGCSGCSYIPTLARDINYENGYYSLSLNLEKSKELHAANGEDWMGPSYSGQTVVEKNKKRIKADGCEKRSLTPVERENNYFSCIDLILDGKRTNKLAMTECNHLLPQSEVIVSKGLPQAGILLVIKYNLSYLRSCYEIELDKNKKAEGQLLVEFKILDHNVTSAKRVSKADAFSDSFETCVLTEIKKWKFPMQKGDGDVTVKFPFSFNNSEE